MKSIFEQVWNGTIHPYELCGKGDPEVEELAVLAARNKESLEKLLHEDQRKSLEQYISCSDSYYYLLIIHAFRSGFSLASSLLTEALAEYKP